MPPRFDQAADGWFESVTPHLSERTQDIYKVALRSHLKAALGALLLCDIDAGRIASYQARRKAEDASARTLNKELQVLWQVLKRYKLWANLQGDVKFERESPIRNYGCDPMRWFFIKVCTKLCTKSFRP